MLGYVFRYYRYQGFFAKDVMDINMFAGQQIIWKPGNFLSTLKLPFRPGVSNTRPAGRMRPANLFCAARDHVHELKKIDIIYNDHI